MKTADAFESLFETGLKPILEPLEKQRKSFVRKFFTTVFVTLLSVAYCFYLLESSTILIGIALFILGWFICRRLYRNLQRDYTSPYKKEIISRAIHFVDDRLKYSPEYGISVEAFEQSSLFPKKISRYTSEDYIEGMIGQTAISFAEIHAQNEEKDSDGHTTQQDIFRGLFFIADFNKRFNSKTIIVPDFFGDSLGKLGRYLQKEAAWGGSAPLVKLEDPEFEKHFAVYGNDQVEARYILSPSLMSRILKFRKENGYVWISFADGNLYMAVYVKENLFEPRIFRTILNPKPLKKYVRYVSMMISIVEDLNLNTRIWPTSSENT